MDDNNNGFSFFEGKPINSDAAIKNVAKGIKQNGSAIVSVLAIVIASMLFFTDMSAGFVFTTSFSTTSVILLCCCIVEYYSNKHTGRQEAKREKVYIDVTEEHINLSRECQDKCSSKGITAFCLDYAEENLVRRRTAILKQAGLTYEEYKVHIGKRKKELPKDMPHHTKKCIDKANKLTPIYLSQDNLIFATKSEKEAKLMLNPHPREAMKDLFFLIPNIASAIFAVGVASEVLTDFSFATVTKAMIKIFFLILNAVRGYQNGYFNVVEGQVECTKARIYLIRECISRHDKGVTYGEVKEQAN